MVVETYDLATTTGIYPHTYNSPFAFAVDICTLAYLRLSFKGFPKTTFWPEDRVSYIYNDLDDVERTLVGLRFSLCLLSKSEVIPPCLEVVLCVCGGCRILLLRPRRCGSHMG